MKWLGIIGILAALALYEVFRSKASRGSCAIGAPAVCNCNLGGVQTSVTCCGQITSDPATWPTGDDNWTICRAIANAEGAQNAGDAPDRYNNPGDLSKGDEHGQAITGYATLDCGEVEIIFASKRAGWDALYAKVSRGRSGRSIVYWPSMTWQQVAEKWAGNSAAWLANVTSTLGVSPTDSWGAYGAPGAAPAACCCCGTGNGA